MDIDSSAAGGVPSPSSPQFTQSLFKSLVAATRDANSLPGPDDFKYFASFPEFRTQSKALRARLLNLMSNVSKQLCPNADETIVEADDDFDRYELLGDAVDASLEAVDTCMDELKGYEREGRLITGQQQAQKVVGTNIKSAQGRQFGGGKTSQSSSSASGSARPQDRFNEPVDNSTIPFRPCIAAKPHAIEPLPVYDQPQAPTKSPSLSAAMSSHLSNLGVAESSQTAQEAEEYTHPYQAEIGALSWNASQCQPCREQLYGPLNETPCHWVDTEAQILELAAKLESVSEFAVDLEHHSYRSYQGFTCLMQVSTRTEDFLVDVLEPEVRSSLFRLQAAFADPKITKVFHGADQDMRWLQRDFGLYCINLFDTGQAARQLALPSFGLAFLLQHFCSVAADKKYQLADWRVRPLAAEMLLYARQDTHYLLYCYDRLKNALVEKTNQLKQRSRDPSQPVQDMLHNTRQQSKRVALFKYKKPAVPTSAHYELCKRRQLQLSGLQMSVLRTLLLWRDETARREDESTQFVMPTHVIISLAQLLPGDKAKLLACCNPVPTLVRQHADAILALIAECKSNPTPQKFRPITPGPPSRSPNSVDDQSDSPPPHASPPMTPFTLGDETALGVRLSPHAHLESPAMTTDQLYENAGWLGVDGRGNNPREFLEYVERVEKKFLNPEQQKQQTKDLNQVRSIGDMPRGLFRDPAAGASVGKAKRSKFFDIDMDDSDEDIAQMDKTKAAAIHASFERGALGFVLGGQQLKQAQQQPKTPAPSSNKSRGDSQTPQMGTEQSPNQPQSISNSMSPEKDEAVPRSMAEVYKISNQNRQTQTSKATGSKGRRARQKEQQMKQHGGDSEMSEVDAQAELERLKNRELPLKLMTKEGAKELQQKAQAESPTAFLKQVGWVDKNEPAGRSRQSPSRPAGQSRKKQNRAHQPRNSHHYNQLPPPPPPGPPPQQAGRGFDYNQHQNHFQQQPQTQPGFNPYGGRGRGGRGRGQVRGPNTSRGGRSHHFGQAPRQSQWPGQR